MLYFVERELGYRRGKRYERGVRTVEHEDLDFSLSVVLLYGVRRLGVGFC